MRFGLANAIVIAAAACSPGARALPTSGNPQVWNKVTDVPVTGTEQWKKAFRKGKFTTASGETLHYRIAAPTGSSLRPLVVVLHGSGAMGSDNEGQLGPFAASWAQLLGDQDSPVVVVPQVAERSADYSLCDGSPCGSRPGPSFDALLQLFDSFAASPEVDVRRLYVVGFSMGASAALQLALARPKLIAGMVVFAPVPPPQARIAELTWLPLLVVHGSRDSENPFGVMRSWVRRLNSAGGKAKLCVRNDMAHQVPDDLLRDPNWRRRLLLQDQVAYAIC